MIKERNALSCSILIYNLRKIISAKHKIVLNATILLMYNIHISHYKQ